MLLQNTPKIDNQFLVSKNKIPKWEVLLFLGFMIGIASAFFSVANKHGEFSEGKAQVVPTAGLVGHWKFDEDTGSFASDSSGSGNTGTLVNGPAWTAGKISNALNFDGINDKVQVTTSGSLNSMTDMTISLWFKQESAGGGGFGRLIRKGNTSLPTSLNPRFEIFASNSAISFNVGYSTSVGRWTVPLPSLNAWHHLAVVYTNGNTSSEPLIYIDGANMPVSEGISPVGTVVADNSTLAIGDIGDGTRSFDGSIDDVRIYNNKLNSSDISNIYSAGGGIAAPPPPASSQPNIVVIMTDDQDDTGSMEVMTKVQNLLAAKGVTFKNSFVNFPLCCPSRATFLTGQEAHNHGVRSNGGSFGGYAKLLPTETNTLPKWLQNSGYHTALIGKYLNGYGVSVSQTYVPPGWNTWKGLVETTTNYITFYNYKLSENGVVTSFGSTAADYQTDVLKQRAVSFINSRAGSSQPFFLWFTPFAPHGDRTNSVPLAPIAAPRHSGIFSTKPLPNPPNFNEADVSDKPAFIGANWPLMDSTKLNTATVAYRKQHESLLAVDEAVEGIVTALESTGKLNNTVIIFTSDNGYFHGEHRKEGGKYWGYEESINVPLIMTGPGIPQGAVVNQLISNIDVPATILELAGATPGRTIDGKSFLSLAKTGSATWRSGFLFQGIDTTNTCGEEACATFYGLRTPRYSYIEHSTGEKELYDLVIDPYQLASKHLDSTYSSVKSFFTSKLSSLKTCSGASCWYTDSDPSPDVFVPPPPPLDTTAPSIPTGLSATPVSTSQINLSWTPSTDAVGVTGYKIFRNGTQITTVTGTTYSNTGLTASTNYSYTVSAYDAAGNNSAQSGSVSATTMTEIVPPPPVATFDYSISNGGSKTVTQGSSVINSISTSLISGTSQSATFSILGLPAGATHSFSPTSCLPTCTTSLTINTTASTPEGTYTIIVSSIAGGITKVTSFGLTVSSAIVPPPPPSDTTAPSVPTGLSATPVSTSQINLSWSASTDAVGVTGYKIFRNGAQITTVTGTTYSNTGLTASTNYTYTVSAYDSAGNNSAQSGSVSATTLAEVVPPPPAPSFDYSISNGGSKTVTQGSSVSNTITATLISGTTQTATFSILGLPSGASATFSPTSCNPTCSSILNISAISSAPTGLHSIIISSVAAGLTKTTSFTLTVSAPVSPPPATTPTPPPPAPAPTPTTPLPPTTTTPPPPPPAPAPVPTPTPPPAPPPSSSSLTETQIQAIISLLTSFGADATTIINVDASLRGLTPPIASPSLPLLTGPFSFGMRSSQVTLLQQYLSKDPSIYTGPITGYYGTLTRQAVIKFQAKYGILQTGIAGPITRAKLNELYGN